MLLTKNQTITRLHKRLSYWSSTAFVDVYDYTLLSLLAIDNPTQEEVTMPWGTMHKAKLAAGLVKDKLHRELLRGTLELLIKRITQLASSGGGSFGAYKIGATKKEGFIPIKKKPSARTRAEAIKRNKELVFLTYGLTLQDEIEKGMHVRSIESPKGCNHYYRSWGASLPNNSPGIALLRWGSPIIMLLGKTLAVMLGTLLNPYSNYYDPKSAMLTDLFGRGVDYRQEFLKGLNSKGVREHMRRSFFSKEGTPTPKFVYRTNLETGVPDKLEVPESYWCESFDGPPIPEFHFHLDYAKNFSLQYSPKEKNTWVLHMPS